jgi:recombination protein RecA
MHSVTEALEVVSRGLRRKWGSRALTKGTSALLQPPEPLSTGYPALDLLLEGGIHRPQLVELLGRPTCGATSLALNLIASAQAQGGDATYLDFAQTFDPFCAETSGVQLKHLLLVRPESVSEAMAIVEDVVQGNGSNVIVVSHTVALLRGFQAHTVLARALQRLTVPLSHSTTAVVFLTPTEHTPPGAEALAYHAALRLTLQGRKWRFHEDAFAGFETTVTLTKHKTIPGQQTAITTRLC